MWEVSSTGSNESEAMKYEPSLNWERYAWGKDDDKSEAILLCVVCQANFDQRAVYNSPCVDPVTGVVNQCTLAYCGPCLVALLDSDKHEHAQKALRKSLGQPSQLSRLGDVVKRAFNEDNYTVREIRCPVCRADGRRITHDTECSTVDKKVCFDNLYCSWSGCSFALRLRTAEQHQELLASMYGRDVSKSLPKLLLPTRAQASEAMKNHTENCIFKPKSSYGPQEYLAPNSFFYRYLINAHEEQSDAELKIVQMTIQARDLDEDIHKLRDQRDILLRENAELRRTIQSFPENNKRRRVAEQG